MRLLAEIERRNQTRRAYLRFRARWRLFPGPIRRVVFALLSTR